MHILLVEDDEFVRAVMVKQLESDGHSVYDVDSAEAGAEALSNIDFDLLITDIILPNADGGQLMKFVKGKGFNIPIIAITGGLENAPEDYANYGDLLADKTMIKPIAKEDLIKTVRQLSVEKGAVQKA